MLPRFTVALACLALYQTPTLADDALSVVIYPGFSRGHDLVIEGRVIEQRSVSTEQTDDNLWTNLWRNVQRLFNDEQADVALTVQIGTLTWPAITDREGYFRIEVEAPTLAAGWQPVSARTNTGVVGQGNLLIIPASNLLGVISDLDDTILVSEVNNKTRLLANSLLKNALQREAVPGMATWYRQLLAVNPHPEAAPMFYLTASPRQLHAGIDLFLRENNFPAGVVVAKKVTGDSEGDPLLDQVAYKTAKIEEILNRTPNVRFVLVGDDGERDPEIYQAVRNQHPQRVAAIWIRRVFPGPERAHYADQGDVASALAGKAEAHR